MAQDFIELFLMLEKYEVFEPELFRFINYTHSLIQSRHRDSVPNTLRKFYECFLYRCEEENPNIRIYYHDDKNTRNINIGKTSAELFKNNKEFYKETVVPFLVFAHNGSHCKGINCANVKPPEIHKSISCLIALWNWYIEHIRPSLKDCLIKTNKFSLPEPLDNECNNLKNKLQAKENAYNKIKEENKLLKEQVEKISGNTQEEVNTAEELDTPEEAEEINEDADANVINMDTLEDDIYNTIVLFNAKEIYCTHRTIALFLLGDRIAQTDFCNFDDEKLFKKYSVNKFSEFEYDLALKNLIEQRKIIQSNMYFIPLPENINIFTELFIKIKTKFSKIRLNKTEYTTKIDEKLVEKIQKAISENKNILVKYYKSVPNTNSFKVSKRILKPLILVPKDKFNEIENLDYSEIYAGNLFYLRANDVNDENKTKTFRLDKIKFIKYSEE